MKKYWSIVFCLFLVAGIQAQDNVIKNLEIRIEAAVLEQDYAKAAKLTKEKEARIELEEALEAKDYERAAELKEQINQLENSKSSSSGVKVSSASQSGSGGSLPKVKSRPASNGDMINNGFFIDALIGYNPKINCGAIGLELGTKWYFGHGAMYRPGIQMVWIKPVLLYNTNGGGVLMEFTPMNLGFSNGINITDRFGLEVNFGMGYATLINFTALAQAHGFNFTPDVKFLYKNLAAGFDFSNSFYNGASISTISLTIGGKF